MGKPCYKEGINGVVEAFVFLFCPFVLLSWSFLVSITPAVSCTGLDRLDNTLLFLVLLKESNIFNRNRINTKQKKIQKKPNPPNKQKRYNHLENFSNYRFWNPGKPNAHHSVTSAGLGAAFFPVFQIPPVGGSHSNLKVNVSGVFSILLVTSLRKRDWAENTTARSAPCSLMLHSSDLRVLAVCLSGPGRTAAPPSPLTSTAHPLAGGLGEETCSRPS